MLDKKLFEHVAFLYGQDKAPELTERILDLLNLFKSENPELAASSEADKVDQSDVILITYGDMVQEQGKAPLHTLSDFLEKYLGEVISTVHILPLYPYSSDDGFSVIDYRKVNPDLGDWKDIARFRENFKLMFDAVVNHISSQSAEFQAFLKGDPDYQNFFSVIEPDVDISQVFRPRATPVLTAFKTAEGEKLVWTTFSADQIDLNYKNPDVLIEVIDILLFYAAQGAAFIRLDAVTYVWKEIGTNCINMPQTHRIVQLLRTILDIAAPNVAIITETNVPHEDNIAYFGDGTNEAQMVYNFALPLLTLHAFTNESVDILSSWAATLDLPSKQAAFFNFLACHDGIGMLPVKNILSVEDLDEIISRTKLLGGNVSYKSNEDGTKSPYELNINYLDALNDPDGAEEDVELAAKRFLATQAIMLALRGVPGIYFHSIFGSQNWQEGVEQTGRYRTINREKLQLERLEQELSDPNSLRHHVYQGFRKLLLARKDNTAFHPYGEQEVLNIHPSVFAVIRVSLDQEMAVLCLQNVGEQTIELQVDLNSTRLKGEEILTRSLTGEKLFVQEGRLQVTLQAYETIWLSR